MIELEDMNGRMFTEGDYVLFSDSSMSLRVAKVRGIKERNGRHQIALEIVKGMGVSRKRYSRAYHPDDFYKIEYVTDGTEL